MEEIYKNGQKVAYGWEFETCSTWSDTYYIYRGRNSLGHFILENPYNGAVFLAKQIRDWNLGD